MPPLGALAVGVDLRLALSGGTDAARLPGGCAPEDLFAYRPNWGLPGWSDGQQTGAPVLGFSRTDIAPGEHVKAVLVTPFAHVLPQWGQLENGDVLRMYHGGRLAGLAVVRCLQPTAVPLPVQHLDQFLAWLSNVR